MTWLYYACYRLVMRIAHRFDWHYAPMIGPLNDGATQRWCQWCGFRETYRPRPGMKRGLSGVGSAVKR